MGDWRKVFIALLGAASITACSHVSQKANAVTSEAAAIKIALDAGLSKNVKQPKLSDMHSRLDHGRWHVWQAEGGCEVFSTDVDAFTGDAGPCSICAS